MNGVDVLDWYLAQIRFRHRTKRWTLKLWFHLFGIILYNAYYLWRVDHPQIKTTFRKFCKNIALQYRDISFSKRGVRFQMKKQIRHPHFWIPILENREIQEVNPGQHCARCEYCGTATYKACSCGVKCCLEHY